MMSFSDDKLADVIDAFNSTYRYWDDILNINNVYFNNMINQIYPSELQLNKANTSDTKAAFLDLHSSISYSIVSSKIYDKRDDFEIEISHFRWWCLSCKPWNLFKPSSKLFHWPFQGGTVLLWIFDVYSVLCPCAFVCVCLYVLVVTCWERDDLFALVCGVYLWVCHFPICILGQLWYLIVSIPDLCTLSYFSWKVHICQIHWSLSYRHLRLDHILFLLDDWTSYVPSMLVSKLPLM